jgi:hypothetical protein
MQASASISAIRNDGIGILVNIFMIVGLRVFCSPHGNDKMIYEIKSTAYSCIAVCGSKKAVNFSSARRLSRSPKSNRAFFALARW